MSVMIPEFIERDQVETPTNSLRFIAYPRLLSYEEDRIDVQCPVKAHRHQLSDCLRRVLLPSAGESDWALRILGSAVEDDSRGHHPGRVLCLFLVAPERAAEVELPGEICLDGWRRVRDF